VGDAAVEVGGHGGLDEARAVTSGVAPGGHLHPVRGVVEADERHPRAVTAVRAHADHEAGLLGRRAGGGEAERGAVAALAYSAGQSGILGRGLTGLVGELLGEELVAEAARRHGVAHPQGPGREGPAEQAGRVGDGVVEGVVGDGPAVLTVHQPGREAFEVLPGHGRGGRRRGHADERDGDGDDGHRGDETSTHGQPPTGEQPSAYGARRPAGTPPGVRPQDYFGRYPSQVKPGTGIGAPYGRGRW
jgi:hypothetical protein